MSTSTESKQRQAEEGLSVLGRLGLAGRTAFYLILVALTARIALLGGASGHQANAHGALALVSRPLIGKAAIAAVALGFVLFGIGRLVGARRDSSVSRTRRAMTVAQGLFYLVLAYVPCAFLAGRSETGSQQQQQKTTGEILAVPGGRVILVVAGLILIGVCVEQIAGALRKDFTDGLDLDRAPAVIRAGSEVAGVVGITARALVFLPIGVFLIVAAVEENPGRSYGTDAELLSLSGHAWGTAVLAVVAAGLGVFAAYSAIETRYRKVVSAR